LIDESQGHLPAPDTDLRLRFVPAYRQTRRRACTLCRHAEPPSARTLPNRARRMQVIRPSKCTEARRGKRAGDCSRSRPLHSSSSRNAEAPVLAQGADAERSAPNHAHRHMPCEDDDRVSTVTSCGGAARRRRGVRDPQGSRDHRPAP
jgi:hypothetical protein